MLAAVDIGNTNIVLGVFDAERLITDFRFSTRHSATADEYAFLLDGLLRLADLSFEMLDGACLCSVVPPLTDTFATLLRRHVAGPLVIVGPGVKTGIAIAYETPREVGADRVVNAVAAQHRFPDCDLIVVDFGTATTFDAVTARGEYLGGVIVPGVTVSLEALFQRTAKLPKVELGRPDTVIGRNTVHSIQSGAYYGYLAMVEGLVARIRAELQEPVRTLATGGLASLVCKDCAAISEVDPYLTLKGLRLIYERNRRPA